MTIPPGGVPKGFPFTKGRVFLNVTMAPPNLLIGAGYIDFEIRTMKIISSNYN